MDCPKCGVYNPEDRKVCWRCDAVLPRPVPRRTPNRQRTAQVWLYVSLAGILILAAVRVCGSVAGG